MITNEKQQDRDRAAIRVAQMIAEVLRCDVSVVIDGIAIPVPRKEVRPKRRIVAS